MTTTIVGYFDDYAEARRAESELIQAGFGEGTSVVGRSGEQEDRDGSWWDRMKAAFGFADEGEVGRYHQAAEHGTLVTVRVPEAQLDSAAAILERHHPVDIDERASSWDGDAKQTLTGLGSEQTLETLGGERAAVESETSIPLAQEELRVGKRSVNRGALRVHTYVTETPVEEQVTLREEQAFVERTPVDRAATAGEAAFQERTLEVEERGEEAVVGKQARVVEEVRVGKQESARTETVRDTVRKTDVKVDRTSEAPRR
jgi:uncharacterized protein (TIGR02271 family)